MADGQSGGVSRWRMAARGGLGIGWFMMAFWLAGAVKIATAGDWFEPLYRIALLGLLLGGYSVMEIVLEGRHDALRAMGFVRRATAVREWALGALLGWGMVVGAVLPMVLCGALQTSLWTEPRAFYLLALNLVVIAAGSLAAEVAFRGYAFQRLIDGVGPGWATGIMAVFFGWMHMRNHGASMSSLLVTMLAGVLLSIAYLRTHALWLPWGLHLAWNLSLGVVLGLPVSGNTDFATVIQTTATGPLWLTGGGYGPEAAAGTLVVLVIGIAVLVRATRDYAWEYTHRAIVAAGYAMDVAPPKAHVEMEAQAAAEPKLVQILPTTPTNSRVGGEGI